MPVTKLLVANRGEIAVRVLRAADELVIPAVAIHAEDDADCLHVRRAAEAVALRGSGAAAYLDIEQVVAAARETQCDAVHPGYGFLSESAAFAAACARAGLTFVGPEVGSLELFGDKARARAAAAAAGVPVLSGTTHATTLAEARAFLAALPPGSAMIVKAMAGGGGRGVRLVRDAGDLEDAYARSQSEARAAFGDGSVYVEQFLEGARHVEVQVAGDRTGAVVHFGERDCTVQRRYQKIVEIAPAPLLPQALRDRLLDAAVALARSARYQGLGTIEFLVADAGGAGAFAFIEANARLQVEHTVTEAVTGVDLVQLQLRLARGESLADCGITAPPPCRGYAIQLRVNMETMQADGNALPSGGVLAAFDPPGGPGVRVDTLGYTGYRTSGRYDSLLAKLIVATPGPRFDDCVARARRALGEFRIDGVSTNAAFLQALLRHPDFPARLHNRYVDEHAGELVAAAAALAPVATTPAAAAGRAGVRVDRSDPLAVLAYGQREAAQRRGGTREGAPAAAGDEQGAVPAPLQGTVVGIAVTEGDAVRRGQPLLVMEAMKMEHEVRAPAAGVVRRIGATVGEALYAGQPLLWLDVTGDAGGDAYVEQAVDADHIRPDLARVVARRATTLDANRADAVARRHGRGQRTARENVEDLCDPGSFVEYGQLVLAAQSRRRSLEELIEKSPADGMITGVGSVNGTLFGDPERRCAVLAYDYTVFAGTQGQRNHAKTDRLIDVAEHGRLPVVIFAEGGGGRPGDTDGSSGSSRTFARLPQLSALVPMVGITTGRCFAGNASVLGVCDVVIATAGSNIGMGGPAMIEGGGLGVFAPEDIGGMDVQVPNGVVDIAVRDEAEAVQVAKRYLSYFQGRFTQWTAPDQRRMRHIVPENRLRVYRVRDVIDTLSDEGTVLELRAGFGIGMVTALVRVEGRPLGIIANNPLHLGGAIDSDAADKASRFMQLCDAFDLPLLFLCDTPGIMVGPEVEKTALVRHANRMFLNGANLTIPFFTVILRKSYGLGAIAMAGGNFRMAVSTVAWPTGEFGGMGLEGSVKLGYRAELAAIADAGERRATYERMVAEAYERGRALNHAATFHVDDTIDPADTRRWLANLLASLRPPPPRTGKKRPAIDAW
jgi:acetyl/propionyl-CoA carboxylase alpha subunit